jgi:hypothetical protein
VKIGCNRGDQRGECLPVDERTSGWQASPISGSLTDQLNYSMIEIGQYGKTAMKDIDEGLASTSKGQ